MISDESAGVYQVINITDVVQCKERSYRTSCRIVNSEHVLSL